MDEICQPIGESCYNLHYTFELIISPIPKVHHGSESVSHLGPKI